MAKGEHYLKYGKYREGIEALRDEVVRHPQNADIYYYLGRFHLALEEIPEGRGHLHKATQLDPNKADYFFWWGVALGVAGHQRQERQAYRRCLQLDPNHSQAYIYLGHNLLDAARYEEALEMYQRALRLTPGNPQALFNRAFVMERMQRTPEAIVAFKLYLSYYPTGEFARRAARHLNGQGDFDYRLYRIGRRQLVVPRIRFSPLEAAVDPFSDEALASIGWAVDQNPTAVLQILTYQKNNLPLAKARALQLKSILLKRYPQIGAKRIRTSWFGVPQKLSINGKNHRLDSSVHFFTTHRPWSPAYGLWMMRLQGH